jgi:hypothetical protein
VRAIARSAGTNNIPVEQMRAWRAGIQRAGNANAVKELVIAGCCWPRAVALTALRRLSMRR